MPASAHQGVSRDGPARNGRWRSVGGHLILRLAKLLAAAFAILEVCPLRYHWPSAGIDPSWGWIMNEGARQGLVAGRDLMFTYGPLAWIALPMQEHLARAFAFQWAFWALFAVLWLWTCWRAPLGAALIASFCLYLGASSFTNFGFAGPDTFLAMTALVALTCAVDRTPLRWVFWTIAVGLAVVLCFIKLSSAVSVASALVLWPAAMYWIDRRAAVLAVGTGFAGLATGVAFGFYLHAHSLQFLGDYLHASLDLSSGYSLAMSWPEPSKDLTDVLLFVVAFASFVAVLVWRRKLAAVMGVVALGPLFLEYKHSIVRPIGHIEIVFVFAPLLLAVIVPLIRMPVKKDWPAAIPLLVLLGFLYSRDGFLFSSASILSRAAEKIELSQETLSPEHLRAKLDAASQSSLAAEVIPGLPAGQPMAVFPFEASYALANHFPLVIFPVPQSYAAYTAFLDSQVARFVNDDSRAPRRILLDWSPIDRRHPFLDVPAWALAMIRHYDLKAEYGEHFVLERRATPRFGELHRTRREKAWLRDQVKVDTTRPLVARIFVKLNLRGTLTNFFYKLPEFQLILSGRQTVILSRIVPDNLSNGIMANFEPRDLASLRSLLRDGKVRDPFNGLRFGGDALAYLSDEIEIEWLEMPGYGLQLEKATAPELPAVSTGPSGQAVIEMLGPRGVIGIGPRELITVECPGYLAAGGWAFDVESLKPASAVYVKLDDELLEAEYGAPRPDVVALFSNRELSKIGYVATIPLSRLGTSEHRLKLIVVSSDGKSVAESDQNLRFRCEDHAEKR